MGLYWVLIILWGMPSYPKMQGRILGWGQERGHGPTSERKCWEEVALSCPLSPVLLGAFKLPYSKGDLCVFLDSAKWATEV